MNAIRRGISRLIFASATIYVAAAVIVISGLVCLIGRWVERPIHLGSATPNVLMSPGIAAGLIFAGASLGLARFRRDDTRFRRTATALAVIACLFGFFTAVRFFTNASIDPYRLVFAGAWDSGRTSFLAGLFLFLSGLGLATVNLTPARCPQPGQAFALLVLHGVALVLLGHVFQNPALFRMTSLSEAGIGFPLAVLFAFLATGLLVARPDIGFTAILSSNTAGGIVVRRLLLAPILIPLAVVGVTYGLGKAGVRIDTDVSKWLILFVYFLFFTAIIWWIGTTVVRLDRTQRRAEAEVRDLYDLAPCGYHSVQPDGTIIAINRTELRWLGYDAVDVIGKIRFVDLLRPESRETYRAAFEKLKAVGEVANVEIDLARKDGTALTVLASSSAFRDEVGRYLFSRTTLTDVTERKRAEASALLFADVARNIPLGVLIYRLDPAGDPPVLRVLSANPEASRLLGVSLDEAAGQTVAAVFPAIPDEQLRRYETVAATGVADDLGEFRYGDERVADRWWSVQAFPLPDRCVGVAFRDVSVRKQAEAEVARLNVELEDRVRIRTAELAEVNQDLVQKNAENEMFVYSVSHDLRSPLVNLQGFSKELDKAGRTLGTLFEEPEVPEPIRDRGRELLAGKFAKSVGFIQTAVLRLSGIIDALLRLSRAGRVEYRWEVVDVSHVVGRVVTAMHATVVEKGAIVNANGLPPAWGDQSAVEQIFANLIGNALAYLDPSRPGRIEVGYLPAGPDEKAQTYFVRDNGLGIPETHQAKIFQVFQRAHPSVAKGEGLGLAIVSRVAERHRGRTWVESRAGEGSTFFVSLPVPPNANGPSTPADPCGNVSEAAS